MTRRASRIAFVVLAVLLSSIVLAVPPADATFPGANGKIAFYSVRTGRFEVYVVNSDGTGETQLTTTAFPRGSHSPTWSPDGAHIAYTSSQSGPFDVWVMNPDGTGKTNLTAGLGGDQLMPAWSPDGSKIVFRNNLPGPSFGVEVWTMNADGTGAALLCHACGANPGLFSWSPDGTKIAFQTSATADSSDFIAMIDSDGTDYHQLCCLGYHSPEWSPSGTYVLVWNGAGESRVNPDGTGLQQIAPNYAEGAPSPDGSRIAAVRGSTNDDVWTIDNNGQDPVQLTTDPTNDLEPDWQPILVGYPRPKGAGTIHAALVPAYQPCASPNRVHAAPLNYGSCNPPALRSTQLTLGTPDANGQSAQSNSSLRIGVVAGNPSTPADEAEANLRTTITDVRLAAGLADYIGSLEMRVPLQITDRSNTPYPGGPGPGTVQTFTFTWSVPCAATADPAVGASCVLNTTADALAPGSVLEGRRAIWQTDQVEVRDAGGDPFLRQGVFLP
jgi:hypothetical protein